MDAQISPEQIQALVAGGFLSPETAGMFPQPELPTQEMAVDMPATPSPFPSEPMAVDMGNTEEPLPFPTPEDVAAVTQVESGGNPNAVSEVGAQGLMQLMPDATNDMAKRLGLDPKLIDLKKPEVNLRLGKEYLKYLNEQLKDPDLAIMAYHAGIGNVQDAIKATGSRDPEVVKQYFTEKKMPRSAAYLDKVQEVRGNSESGAPVQAAQADPQTMTDAAPANGFEQQQLSTVEELASLKENEGRITAATIDQNKMVEEELKRKAADEAYQQQVLQEAKSKYEAVADTYLNSGIDQDRLYKNTSTGDKILAAISIGLGGFLAGQKGGENQALKIIMDAIDKDIEVQKLDIDKKGNAAKNARTAYTDMLQIFGDENSAKNATFQLMLKKAENTVQGLIANNKVIQDQGTAQRLLGELQQKQIEYSDKIGQENIKNKEISAIQEAVKTGIVDWKKLPPSANEKYVSPTKEFGGGFATDSITKRNVEGIISSYSTMKDLVNELKADREKFGGSFLPGQYNERKAKYETTMAQLSAQLKGYYTLGAYDAGVKGLVEEMLPNKDEFLGFYPITRASGVDPAIVKIDSFLSNLEGDFKRKMRLGVPYQLRGLSQNSNTGLSLKDR